MQSTIRFVAVIGFGALLLGCGAESKNYSPANSSETTARGLEAEEPTADFDERLAGMQPGQAESKSKVTDATDASASDVDNSVKGTPPVISRKIIYNADVRLVVRDFDAAEAELRKLVEQRGGFLSSATVDRTSGAYRTGRWVVRLPVGEYASFLSSIGTLGIPESLSERAQDVTEEFVDIQARIDNKQKLEQRIVELLKETKDGVKDVIEVERELGRVREEIERMQGRLRYLRDQTSLSTITISVTERRDYIPPQAPTFGGRISETWSNSWSALSTFGKDLLVFFVAATPWLLAVGLFIALPIFLFLRALNRHARKAIQAVPVDER